MLQPFKFEVKSLSASGEIEGFASTYTVDQGGDKVMPGAFAKSIAARPGGVPMLWSHRPDEPIGLWTALTENKAGLYVKGALVMTVAKAQETFDLLKAKVLSGLSIGYRTVKADFDQQTGVRQLKELDLQEISICTFPMNPEARVVAVKAADITSEREFERFLHNCGFTRTRAKILAKGFVPATKGQRDADQAEVSEIVASIRAQSSKLSKGDHSNGLH
jgi:HK97 family phage prohead protease